MKNKLSPAMFAAAVLMIVLAVSLISYAAPGAQPPNGNVDASFSTVKLSYGPASSAPYGRFVGVTGTSYDGRMGLVSGSSYATALKRCQDAYPTPLLVPSPIHVCTAKEITNTYDYETISQTGMAWINNGPPAYIDQVSNDCFGWAMKNSAADRTLYFGNTTTSAYGSTWDFTNKQSFMDLCDDTLPVACCSY